MNDDGDSDKHNLGSVDNVDGDDLQNGYDNDDGNAAVDGDGNDSDDKITFAGATKHPGSSHWCQEIGQAR